MGPISWGSNLILKSMVVFRGIFQKKNSGGNTVTPASQKTSLKKNIHERYLLIPQKEASFCLNFRGPVDGRNPAPPEMYNTP